MLVGRDTELRQVSTMLAEGRRPLLYGEAGVGKTTLARAAAAASGRELFEAGALATLTWLPYLPFRRLLGRQPVGDAPSVAAEVERAVGDGVVFLDDLHWADRETRAVVALLTDRVDMLAAVRRGSEALEVLDELGGSFELLPVEALPDAAAAQLVELVRPGLPHRLVTAVLQRAGGNPLLLQELAASGEPTESLRLALAARLRALTPAAVEGMALLALAGRPVEEALAGPAAAELVEAGLAVRVDETLAVRHALLGEAAVSLLEGGRRQQLHERLGRAIPAPGESARHFAEAGLPREAYAAARRAAGTAATPGERAAHLGLAAACATGAEADGLRLQASSALIEAGRSEEALLLLERVESRDPLVRAGSRLLEYQAADALHQPERARAAWADARALAEGTGDDVEVLVSIESAAIAANLDRDPAEALRRAEAAHELARARGRHLQRARLQLGAARLLEGKPGWERLLRAAIDGSFEERDYVTAGDAVSSLVYGLMISGKVEAGSRLAAKMAKRAEALELVGLARWLRAWLAGFLWHTGAPAAAVDEAAELVRVAVEPRERRRAEVYLAQALIELARFDEARQLVDGWRDGVLTDSQLWAVVELEHWSGRPREARVAAADCLENFPADGPPIFVRLIECWASLELGLDPGAPRLAPYHRMAEAAPAEELAVRALADGRPAEAVDLLDRAASLWRGRHSRGEVRCLWGAGEAARRAGDVQGARRRLELAEARALECGALAIHARVHRSLRLAGVRRAAARGERRSGITAREREVLALVGAGLSNAEIGRRLGIGRPTVARLVTTASVRLGADSRLQAAVLAAQC